jgi:hypothetical protein
MQSNVMLEPEGFAVDSEAGASDQTRCRHLTCLHRTILDDIFIYCCHAQLPLRPHVTHPTSSQLQLTPIIIAFSLCRCKNSDMSHTEESAKHSRRTWKGEILSMATRILPHAIRFKKRPTDQPVTVAALIRRHSGLTPEQFHRYWLFQHTKIVLPWMLKWKVLSYRQFHLEAGELVGTNGGFDGYVEITFPSAEQMSEAFEDNYHRQIIKEDEKKFFLQTEGVNTKPRPMTLQETMPMFQGKVYEIIRGGRVVFQPKEDDHRGS